MRKKLFTFLLALVASVGMSWAMPTEFANCYDCWRDPEYPTISGQCNLFNFGNPGVGNGNPSGPWKLEFVENYNSSSTEYDDIVNSYAASEYGKTPEQMEVYRLYQWQNGAYQPVAYGVLYAYANENNQVEHAAFFEANGYYGCYLTGNTHSGGDDFNITFDEDAATGFGDLHPASTPNSIVINGTPAVGDNSISLTYYFDPANVPGITGYAPTLKVKCVTDNKWDEEWLSLSEIRSGTTTITLNELGSFQAGKSYEVCFAYYNGSWVDEMFQSFSFDAPIPSIPEVGMKGSWDNWADVVNFADNGNGTASATKNFEHEGYYTFKTVLNGDDWRGNGYTYKRSYTGAEGITGNTDMTLWVDAKGTYTFTWIYATNAINISYPELPTIQTKGSWDDWAGVVNFTDNGDGTASATKNFDAEGYHTFKVNVGTDDWRGNGETFKRDYTGANWINENGSDMKLYVDEPGNYTFTWNYVENALSIFFPDQTTHDVPTNEDPQNPSYHYSTFYHSANKYELPANVEAFVADLSDNNLILTRIAVTSQTIPSNTAVILRRTGSNEDIQLIPSDAEAVTFTSHNSLQGRDMETPIAELGLTRTTCYVLSGADNVVGFYQINSDYLKAHKAYVPLNSQNNAPRHMRFIFDQATGVENVSQEPTANSQKLIENGVLYIIRDGVRYNVQGQKVK